MKYPIKVNDVLIGLYEAGKIEELRNVLDNAVQFFLLNRFMCNSRRYNDTHSQELCVWLILDVTAKRRIHDKEEYEY